MTLLEILVQELPKRGGWPNKYNVAHTDGGLFKIVFAGPNLLNFAAPWSEGVDISTGDTLITRERYETALAAIEPEWNGEGLPPLNTEVEFIMESTLTPKWNRCKLMGYSEFWIAIQPLNGEFSGHMVWWSIPGKGENVKFRPIRSEADRKCDEAIKQMVEVYRNALGATEDAFSEVYSAIAAGKIPHLKIV